MFQDSVNRPNGTRPFLLPVLCHGLNYSFYRFQMTLETIRFFESPSFTFSNSLFPAPFSVTIPSTSKATLETPRHCQRIRTEWTSGKVPGVHVAAGATHTFGSPGFGPEIELAPADTAMRDSKRRRIDQGTETSTSPTEDPFQSSVVRWTDRHWSPYQRAKCEGHNIKWGSVFTATGERDKHLYLEAEQGNLPTISSPLRQA